MFVLRRGFAAPQHSNTMTLTSTQMVRILIAIIAVLAIALCALLALRFWPSGGSPVAPLPTPAPTVPPARTIQIDTPTAGAAVASPITISGRVDPAPAGGALTYRLFDAGGSLIATGALTVQGAAGQPGVFSGSIPYTLSAGGPGRIEVVELNSANGAVLAFVDLPVTLNAAAPQPSPGPGGGQAITIETPPPGTEVGSPVVLTGRTTRAPSGNRLSYSVRDAAGAQIGGGAFDVGLAADGGSQFVASLVFNLPPNGGTIIVEIFEPGAAGAPSVATANINLSVSPPQAITIETPPPGTTVGSPVVITGRTARFPFQGNLGYRFFDLNGRTIGGGVFPVNGQPGGPTTFIANLEFTSPPNGGAITAEIFDQNAADGQTVASASLSLNVAPPPQQIIIETPPSGTTVGSPVVLTGRTVRFPAGGQLNYRVRGGNGSQIGGGVFAVAGTAEGSATFNASLTFTPPPQGGPIAVELFEVDPANGQVITSSILQLTVAGPPVTAVPPIGILPTVVPPTPTAPPVAQAITIETPPPGTEVGSPLVVTGRLTRFPVPGELNYRITTADRGLPLGDGVFPVRRSGPAGTITFTGELEFLIRPGFFGDIDVQIYERDPTTGVPVASATVRLTVARPQPRTGNAAPRVEVGSASVSPWRGANAVMASARHPRGFRPWIAT
jgi:hypothetical protein